MSEANKSAAAETQPADSQSAAGQAPLEQVLNSAEEAAQNAVDFSEAGVTDFLTEELNKLLAEPKTEDAKRQEEIQREAHSAEVTEEAKEPETDVSQLLEEDSANKPETDEAGEEESVFEREENQPILSDEEIDERFERTPHAIRNELKRVSVFARQYQDFVDSIGGQDFVPVAANITKALSSRDHNGVFTSLVTSLGLPSFADILESAVNLAFVQPAEQEANTEESRWFLNRMKEIADQNFEARYGKGLNTEVIDRLVRLNRVGAFDLDSLEELYADELKPENSAAVERLQQELAREREEKEALKRREEAEQQQEAEKRAEIFDNLADQSIEKAFEPTFSSSVLRAEKGDKPEDTAVKEALRQAIILHAQSEFRKAEGYKTLRERFAGGEARTAVFTADLGAAVSKARTETRLFAAKFERLYKDVLAGKRNSQVLAPKETVKTEEKQPTATIQFDTGGKSTREMTDEEFDAYMKRSLAAIPQR